MKPGRSPFACILKIRGIFKSYIGDDEKQKQFSSMGFIIQAIKLIKMKMDIIGL
jgi:hypothetical protein